MISGQKEPVSFLTGRLPELPGLIFCSFVIVVCFLIFDESVHAQSTLNEPDHSIYKQDRPRVGLVLSGGAAKGLAHIGAIRVLEEAGMPVDIVTGTSMGSIVGGLYAIGYTPEMLEQIINEQNWEALLTDTTPQNVLDLQRRQLSRETLFSIPVLRRGLTLPGGLVQGQLVFNLLNRLTWPYHHIDDFSQLPRSFAAIVMDQQSGEAVTMTTGSLSLAIRASMSIPALFEPVVIDGRSFVDGGLIRNLPASDARELGADILICIDVSEPPPDEETITPGTISNVLMRTAFRYFEAPTQEEQEFCDVLITPETGDLGYFSFDQSGEWIARGAEAADLARSELDSLVKKLGGPCPSHVPVPQIEAKKISSVEIYGVSDTGKRIIRNRLDLNIPGTFTPEEIHNAIDRIYTEGGFERVSYNIIPYEKLNSAGDDFATVNRLRINARELDSDLFGFGMRYDNKTNTAVLLKLSVQNRLGYGSLANFTTRIGRQTQLHLETFIPLSIDSPYGLGGDISYSSTPVELLADNIHPSSFGELNVYETNLYLSRSLGKNAFVRVGLHGEHLNAIPSPETGTHEINSIESYKETFYSGKLNLQADTRNELSIPTQGFRTYLKLQFADNAIGSGITFRHFVADKEVYRPLSHSITAIGRVVLTRGSGPDLPPGYLSFIGGLYPVQILQGRIFPLPGLEEHALTGRSGQLALAGLRWKSPDDIFIELSAHSGAAGDNWVFNPADLYYGFSLTAGLLTIIGPVSVTFAGNRLNERPQVGLNIGFRF